MPLDFSLKPATHFAPAEREAIDVIKAEQSAILGTGAAAAILETLREPVAIVNGLRQIVHANKAFLAFAGAARLDDILGMRLGEFLGCAHAAGDMGGCGTHPTCQTCGAVNAVLSAAAGTEVCAETDLAVASGGRERRLRFEVTAAPFESGGWRFVLMTVRGARWAAPA
jgi:PAS domain-containing protein